jgi:hypothetical protein
MSLNFPSSPSIGQIYTDSVSGFSYEWNGTVWISFSGASSSQIKILDDISGSFTGVGQTFALTSNTISVTPPTSQSLIINLGGVIQDATDDYSVSGSNIVFSTPPTNGLSFSGISLGPAVPIGKIFDGAVTDGSLTVAGILSTSNLFVTGISTLGNTVVGGATTQLFVTGNARVTGILTIGTSSLTLDGVNDRITVGSGLTITTSGITIGPTTINSSGSLSGTAGTITTLDTTNLTGTAGTITTFNSTVGSITNLTSTNVNASGIVTATTFVGALTGTASNVTTNANLTGDVTSVGNATAIAAGVIVNADISASAAIVDTKLATIATAGKVSNSATTATDANTASAIVARSAAGNFNITSINSGPLAGFRNAIINGGMQVAQRAAPTITATPQYGQADRFVAYISGGTGISGTINQGADAQFKSGYRLWLASLSYTSGTWAIQQRIESFNSIGLNGSTVTVSFKLYHDFGSSRTVGVSLAKANAVDNFSSVTAIATGYTSPALTSNAYSNVSCSFVIGASDATNGLMLQIADSSATTVSAKNLIIGDVQLEIGPVATPFERRPIGTELALCQRYFLRGNFKTNGYYLSAFGTQSMFGFISFTTYLRANPTVTLSSMSTSNINSGTLAVDYASGLGFMLQGASTANAPTTAVGVFFASAEL